MSQQCCRLVAALAMLAVFMSGASAKDNFVTIRLPKNVEVQLPRNWTAITNHSRTTLDAAAQALSETAGVVDLTSNLAFAANLYDDRGQTVAMFNIRSYPEIDVGQPEVKALTKSELQAVDEQLSAELTRAMLSAKLPIVQWLGTRQAETDNGGVVLITEYRRKSANVAAAFRVQLLRVLNREKSFTVTISRREDLDSLLGPICGKIARSIHFW